MTFVSITVTYPKSRSQRDAFREGTPEGGAGAVLVNAAIHCAHGRLGHRPVRHVPDCEVLAALVPERVLPFASGGSRKRGPGRAEAKTSDAAVGRRKASAPAPFFEVQGSMKSWASVLPQWEDRREGARRIACRCGSGWCASRRSASLLVWRLVFRGVRCSACARTFRENESACLSSPASAGRKERRPLPRGRAEC